MKIMLLTSLFLLGASSAAAHADNKSAARERFEKGVAAFSDKRFGEAADEFEGAYRLEPAFQVLFNIGQVNVALGRSVEAVTAFEHYLKQGAAAVPTERRREVKTEIDKQLARIGSLSVKTHPNGADVRLDGRLIGKTPLAETIRVNAGRHVVEAFLAAHATQIRDVDVAGQAEIAVELTLEEMKPAPPARAEIKPEPLDARPAPAPTPSPTPLATAPASTTPRELSPASPVGWQRVAGIALAVAGLATATTGGLLAYSGANRANDARGRLALPFIGTEQQWNAAASDYNAGKDRNQLGWIVAGVGAAAVAGGILLVATAHEPRGDTNLALAPWLPAPALLHANAGGLLMTGSF